MKGVVLVTIEDEEDVRGTCGCGGGEEVGLLEEGHVSERIRGE
jgi:hypothetical protein